MGQMSWMKCDVLCSFSLKICAALGFTKARMETVTTQEEIPKWDSNVSYHLRSGKENFHMFWLRLSKTFQFNCSEET